LGKKRSIERVTIPARKVPKIAPGVPRRGIKRKEKRVWRIVPVRVIKK
jgi:hypothetical protein